ncbi:uncharacterized protein DUF3891 [Jatrophihabitans sp. GAS493]|uniref:DUF3891 family protein n=1 Tax=Jatrophihabitans sp. GAS493 TaxID=1907575 RepID=UPI000BB7E7BB|nr:DUF3891 family protein [Jatrophihabitans sp. GAS493]SOD70366.1 uncharacterized protein DUF3891 [Jatrophihabitans sp. GAS493]
MILSRWQGRLMVVLQPDHGVQTGLIAAAWGSDDVPRVEDFVRATTLAARHHDDGWAVWERHPTLEPMTQQPVQFHAVSPIEHIAAYRAGIARAAQLDPWTGLLVSMHGAGLYNDRYGTYRLAELVEQELSITEQRVVAEFLTDMAELQQRLATVSLGHAPATAAPDDPLVRHHYLLLQVWDRISLQFAYRHAADDIISPLPSLFGASGPLCCRANGEMSLTLDPYPFAVDGAVFPVRAYLLEDRSYVNPEDFLNELTSAPVIELECTTSRRR